VNRSLRWFGVCLPVAAPVLMYLTRPKPGTCLPTHVPCAADPIVTTWALPVAICLVFLGIAVLIVAATTREALSATTGQPG
jgi:hypothetical protein